MKLLMISIFLFALVATNCKSSAKITKVSATSTFEKSQDFLNCDNIKQSMIDGNNCKTEGIEGEDKICEEYNQQLDKELDCKKSCKQFYKKYFDLTVEAKKKQVKYYEESKQKKLKKDVEFEIKQIENSQNNLIEANCIGDIFNMGNKEKK